MDLQAQGIPIGINRLRHSLETQFPSFKIAASGMVSQMLPPKMAKEENSKRLTTLRGIPQCNQGSSNQRINMVQTILNKKCPIPMTEILGKMRKQGISMDDSEIQTILKSNLPEFNIDNSLVFRIRVSSQKDKAKPKPPKTTKSDRLEEILKQGCPMTLSHIRAWLKASGNPMVNKTIRSLIESNLPAFKVKNTGMVVQANRSSVIRTVLNKNCPFTFMEAQATLKMCGIQMTESNFRSYLKTRFPEFKIDEGGMITWFGDPCLLALESISKQGFSVDIADIAKQLKAKGIAMTKANVKLVIETRLPGLKFKDDDEVSVQERNDTIKSNVVESVPSFISDDKSSCCPTMVLNQPSTPISKDQISLVQRILDEKCPISLTKVQKTLPSLSIHLSQADLRDLIVEEISDYFIVKGFIYSPISKSCNGSFMATLVFEALYPHLEDKLPHSIDSLLPVLAAKGIEVSGNKLKKMVSDYSFSYVCQGNCMSLKKRCRETLDPKSLEEIVMGLKSLDINKNALLTDENGNHVGQKEQ